MKKNTLHFEGQNTDFYEILRFVFKLLKFTLENGKALLIITSIGIFLGFITPILLPKKYKSELVFVLEQARNPSDISNIASQFGVNLGSEASGLSGNNLLTLMKSRRIIEDVLFQPINYSSGTKNILELFLKNEPNIQLKWEDKNIITHGDNIYNPKLDSALEQLINETILANLKVEKINEDETFVSVSYEGKDPIFAKCFVENLVTKSVGFYIETKMSNANANIAKLEQRVDSVSNELKAAMVASSANQDANLFVIPATSKVASIQLQLKTTMLTTLYGELIKNLELSKTMASREEPLITIIDRPHYPKNIQRSKIKFAAIGGALGFSMALTFLIGRRIILDFYRKEYKREEYIL
jgi:hypothetical protein